MRRYRFRRSQFMVTLALTWLAMFTAQVAELSGQVGEPDPVATSLNPNGQRDIFPFALHNVAFDPTGELLAAGSGDGFVRVVRADTGEIVHRFQAHEDWAFTLAFSEDGKRLFSGGGDDLIRMWDLDDPSVPEREFSGHTMDVHALALTPSGDRLLSVGDDQLILVWDLETSRPIMRMRGHEKQIPTIDVNPVTGTAASGSRDHSIRLWDPQTGEELAILEGHTADVMSVQFAPNGRFLASGSYDQTVRIWDDDMASLLATDTRHDGAVVSIAISPDSRWVASVDHQDLKFTPAPGFDGAPRSVRLGGEKTGQLSFVRYAPRGDRLAVTTTMGQVLIVNSRTMELERTVETRPDTADGEATADDD